MSDTYRMRPTSEALDASNGSVCSWQLKTIELTPNTKRLVPGDRVQLGFCLPNTGIVLEHLWVRVGQALWDGKFYFGALDQDSICIDGLTAGQPVKFWPKHVARVQRPVQGDIY